ncbi:MAG: signal recognition particle-docking protein FtsY [Legionellales bacterium]|nr:signal recognition particle-docking protein FtsY [Legionellales bacterium]
MLRLFKRNKDNPPVPGPKSPELVAEAAPNIAAEEPAKPAGFFTRLRQGLSKTRKNLAKGLANALLGKKTIDAELLEEIETHLLLADVGVETTCYLIDLITDKLRRNELSNPEALMPLMRAEMTAILEKVAEPLKIESETKPYVILVVGINGAGKTTTIGKLAHFFQEQGKTVMLAAGDTFRAAAIEQLQVWGERNNIPVVAQQSGADSASVIFDAMQSAKAKGVDILIADTAGRLHTQVNLMEELKKVRRVLGKIDGAAPHEVLLVLDAGTGQNALNQARQFQQAVGVTGLVLTKLDGTAKGGIIFALAKQLNIAIRFIGVGEQINDLRPFSEKTFIEALFSDE